MFSSDPVSAQTFFNSEALNLIRALVVGGDTQELEHILAEGIGLVRGDGYPEEFLAARNRCRVALLPLDKTIDGILSKFCVSRRPGGTVRF